MKEISSNGNLAYREVFYVFPSDGLLKYLTLSATRELGGNFI